MSSYFERLQAAMSVTATSVALTGLAPVLQQLFPISLLESLERGALVVPEDALQRYLTAQLDQDPELSKKIASVKLRLVGDGRLEVSARPQAWKFAGPALSATLEVVSFTVTPDRAEAVFHVERLEGRQGRGWLEKAAGWIVGFVLRQIVNASLLELVEGKYLRRDGDRLVLDLAAGVLAALYEKPIDTLTTGRVPLVGHLRVPDVLSVEGLRIEPGKALLDFKLHLPSV